MSDPQFEAATPRSDAPAMRNDWCLDVPDHRDYSVEDRKITAALSRLKPPRAVSPPGRIDWRESAPRVTTFEPRIASATAACIALIEHFERRSSGRKLNLSCGFLDSTVARCATAAMGQVTLRTVLKAARRCGVPPEKYWPTRSDRQHLPDPFAYCFQRYFRTIRYVRLDKPLTTGDETLRRVKALLAAGFPLAFGFAISNSLGQGPDVWYPTSTDDAVGGIVATAVGFDDQLRIRSDKGALLVRAPWGPDWGEAGFAWLPYSFVRQRLAADFWTLLKPSWLRSGEFDAPQL